MFFKSNSLCKLTWSWCFWGFSTQNLLKSTIFKSPQHTKPFLKRSISSLKNQGKILQKKHISNSKNLRKPKLELFSYKTFTFGRAKMKGVTLQKHFVLQGLKFYELSQKHAEWHFYITQVIVNHIFIIKTSLLSDLNRS